MKKLMLEIHSVKCRDETGGMFQEKFGGDEIALAGINIDPNGHAKQLPHFGVGNFEKDGVVRNFQPPHLLSSFDLQQGPPFPRLYQTALILAELDEGGGLDSAVAKLVAKTNAAGGSVPGAADSAVLGPVLEKLGELLLKEGQKLDVCSLNN